MDGWVGAGCADVRDVCCAANTRASMRDRAPLDKFAAICEEPHNHGSLGGLQHVFTTGPQGIGDDTAEDAPQFHILSQTVSAEDFKRWLPCEGGWTSCNDEQQQAVQHDHTSTESVDANGLWSLLQSSVV